MRWRSPSFPSPNGPPDSSSAVQPGHVSPASLVLAPKPLFNSRGDAMNVLLWIGQGGLAGVFLLSGIGKSTQSRERMLATGQTAAEIVPVPVLRVAGVSELFGALGVILPWLTGIARVLT